MSDPGTVSTAVIDVAYLARLARLHLDQDEVRTFQAQLGQVVEYVRQIDELDLDGIEPTSHASAVTNVFREDNVRQGLDPDRALSNAPAQSNGQFRVPRIVE